MRSERATARSSSGWPPPGAAATAAARSSPHSAPNVASWSTASWRSNSRKRLEYVRSASAVGQLAGDRQAPARAPCDALLHGVPPRRREVEAPGRDEQDGRRHASRLQHGGIARSGRRARDDAVAELRHQRSGDVVEDGPRGRRWAEASLERPVPCAKAPRCVVAPGLTVVTSERGRDHPFQGVVRQQRAVDPGNHVPGTANEQQRGELGARLWMDAAFKPVQPRLAGQEACVVDRLPPGRAPDGATVEEPGLHQLSGSRRQRLPQPLLPLSQRLQPRCAQAPDPRRHQVHRAGQGTSWIAAPGRSPSPRISAASWRSVPGERSAVHAVSRGIRSAQVSA